MGTTINYEELYTNLGYLFYSVAANDRSVRPEERIALRTIIKKDWLPLENSRDEVGTDEGHYIDIAFDYAVEQHLTPDEAFERFAGYVRKEAAALDEGLQRMIMNSALAIADASGLRNKAERARLDRLSELFAQKAEGTRAK